MAYFQQLFQRTHFWIDRRPQLLLRLTIFLLVILTSLYLAIYVGGVSQFNRVLYNPVLILVVGLASSIVFLAYPWLGLVALAPSLILVTLDIGTGSETRIGVPILLLALLIGLWFFDMVARQRSIRFINSPVIAPLFAFLVASLIALGIGQLPWFDFYRHAPIRAQVGEVGIFFISFLCFLWVGHNIPDLGKLKTAMILFFAAAVILMLGFYSSVLARATSRFVHFAISGGSMFWTWLAALTFSQIILNRKLPVFWRVILIGILASCLYIGFIKNQAWTSGWLPPLLSMLVILWFGVPKIRKLLVLAGILVAIFLWQKVSSVLLAGDNQYSLSTRLAAWNIIFQIIPIDPLFGLGPANYYWYTPLFSIMGYRVVFNSHNNYVDLIAQLGIVGTVCFAWFAWAVLRVAWRLRRIVPEGFERAYVYGILGGWVASLAAGMFGDWVLPFVYNVGYAGLRASLICWFFLGGLLYLERLYAGKSIVEPVEQE